MSETITVRDVLTLQNLRVLSTREIMDLLHRQDEPFSLDLMRRQFGGGLITRGELEHAQDHADRQLEQYDTLRVSPLLISDPRYPILLRNIANPPLILYTKGNINRLNDTMPVAIIGSRNATPRSQRMGHRLGQLFSGDLFSVVSGLAVGCDAAAHQGCLDTSDGYTIAVLANSLDYVYPKEHTTLAQVVIERGGCLVSEQPIGSTLHQTHFVQRNRIQSGISLATILVQSEIKGGSMHTMKFARAQGRMIAACDPIIGDAAYAGNQRILDTMESTRLNSLASIEEFKEMIFAASLQTTPVDQRSLSKKQLVFDL